eukprot:scaffold3523_cov194-Alexandrium_tamarense.AAC.8
MEEVGKGARLVFRYPASPPPYFLNHHDGAQSSSDTGGILGDDVYNANKAFVRGAVPSSPMPSSKNMRPSSTNVRTDDNGSAAGRSIDLFFDLPARVISKLFRPKRPLCGCPLTLNVSGTTFCCRAELFDQHNICPSAVGGGTSGGTGDGSHHPLVLFSVIVALAPLASASSLAEEQFSSTQQYCLRSHSTSQSNVSNGGNKHHFQYFSSKRVDSAFTTIRRVHRNLARLCRVLTREELRCQYVSVQCNLLLNIRKEYEGRNGADEGANVSGGTAKGNTDSSNNKKEDNNTRRVSNTTNTTTTGNTVGGPTPLQPTEKRVLGSPPTPSTGTDNTKTNTNAGSTNASDNISSNMTPTKRRVYVQNLIEVMLAAIPPSENDLEGDNGAEGYNSHHNGNLARELAQVFHSLSKYDDPANQSVSSFTSRINSREGIVYINRHVAVPLESVDVSPANEVNSFSLKGIQGANSQLNDIVRPYHTLLFPNSTASEVLRRLIDESTTSGVVRPSSGNAWVTDVSSSPPLSHTLRRILPHLHPRKSLQEVSWDSALALPFVMESARYLVESRLAVPVTPLLRKNRYACSDDVIGKMRKLALPFWQTFGLRSQNCRFYLCGGATNNAQVATGAPHLFAIVSALTTNQSNDAAQHNLSPAASPMLGDAIDSLCGTIKEPRIGRRKSNVVEHGGGKQHGSYRRASMAVGEVLTSNAMQLNRPASYGSTGIVTTGQDSPTEEILYSVVVWLLTQKVIVEVKDYLLAVGVIGSDPVGENDTQTKTSEEVLFTELFEAGCLDGTISIPAICYRFGLDRLRMESFTAFGKRRRLIEIVSRAACSSDDWGAP